MLATIMHLLIRGFDNIYVVSVILSTYGQSQTIHLYLTGIEEVITRAKDHLKAAGCDIQETI